MLTTVGLLLVAGCWSSAHVSRLTVTPTEVCPNDSVQTSWAAEGAQAQLRQDPAMSLAQPLAQSEGIQSLSGDRDFDVVLEARGGGDAWQRRYVHVVTESWTFVLSGPPQCRDGEVVVDVDFHVSDPQIDARLQVTSVVARSDRSLTVVHAGVPAVTIPPGSTTVFRGTPLAGLWTLSGPLKPGESCEAGAASVPLAPAVLVSGTCGGLPPLVQRHDSLDGAPRCGHLGQICCADDTCRGPYRCDRADGGCVDPQRPSAVVTGRRCNRQAATVRSRTFVVAIRDQFGCGEVTAVLADSREEANACARQAVGGPSVIQDVPGQHFEFCRDGRTRIHVLAFSEEDSVTCARHHWPAGRLDPGLCG